MANARRTIQNHHAQTIVIAENANISGGVQVALPNFLRFTLYLRSQGAINIEYLFSPNGTDFFDAPEGPVVFPSADETVVLVEADTAAIKLTGSTTALVTAMVRGTF